MSKTKKYILISSIISFISYIGMSTWLHLQNQADPTGWGSIGVVAFTFMIIIPIISIAGGISGQIITRKFWLFPVINSIGAALYIAAIFIFMSDIRIGVLLLIPIVFVFTLVFSAITLGVQKLLARRQTGDGSVSD